MSIIDQKEFLKSIHPFDELTQKELDWLIKRIDIAFFPKDSTIIKEDTTPLNLYVIIKGEVAALQNGSLVMLYNPKDSFDAEALIEGVSKYEYVANEDSIVYEIKKDIFLKLFEQNSAFREFYTLSMVKRIEYLKQKEQNSSNIFLTAKVEDSYLHKPCIVEFQTPLKEAIAKSIELNRSEIIVQNKNSFGIITDSDIKKLLFQNSLDLEKSVGEFAKFPVIGIAKDDFLFNAYLSLIEKNIKRLVVFEDEKIVGVIEQIDILSFFANKSHLLTLKIQKAATLEELKRASRDYLDMVERLFNQGVKSRYIAKLISEINRKLFLKVYELFVPKELQQKAALIVMGSEGRKEQIIKTDQDNALIVANSEDIKKYLKYMNQIGETLLELGYPKCPGNMMVTNPFWQDSINGYKQKINKWLNSLDEQSFIEFATFFDAAVVAGDSSLLKELKGYIFNNINEQNSLYLANFAKLALQFPTPVGFFSSILGKDKIIDIKKAGIFPIVQGVRALSLKYKINKNSTIERLKELSNKDFMEIEFAKEVAEAFEALSYLRVKAQLEAIKSNKELTNEIETSTLTKIQRDLLKDSLLIVDRFKKYISKEFRLEMLPQ